MKKVTIKEVEIIDWKGQTNKVILNGNTMIKGFNEEGKTTIMKAWSWLLTGLIEAGYPVNHELYDNKKEITENTPTARVKFKVRIGEYDYLLEKTAKATFKRDMESERLVKAPSDTYKWEIDEIGCSASNFKKWLETNLAPIDILPYLIHGSYFIELSETDKDKARKVLQGIVGEIKQTELRGDYSILFPMMERYSIEELKEQTKSKIKPIKDKLGSENKIGTLQVELEAKEAEFSVYNTIDFDGILTELEGKKAELKKIDEQLLGDSNSIKPLIDKRNEELGIIQSKKFELANLKSAYEQAQSDAPNKIMRQIISIQAENKAIEKENSLNLKEIEDAKNELKIKSAELKSLNAKRTNLLTQRDEVKERIFSAEHCAYCGQELPIDKLQELQDKFNAKKKSDLDAIVLEGKATKAKIEYTEKTISELSIITNKEVELKPLKDTTELEQEYEKAKANILPFEDTADYKRLSKEIVELTNNLTVIPKINNDDISVKKASILNDISELDRKYGHKEIMQKCAGRIAEIRAEQLSNASALAKLEKLSNQIKRYEQEKADITSVRINDKLEYTFIQMEEVQKDGNKKPSCIVTKKNGTKWSTTNGGSKILMLIDIQKLFCKHYGILMPIFVDEVSVLDQSKRPSFRDFQTILLMQDECKFTVEPIEYATN